MSDVRAIILDVDGTLILSNDAHARAFVDAARELGHPGVEFAEVRRLIGMGSDKLIPRVFGFEKESEAGERVSERKGEIFRERYLPRLAAAPGARPLLERLRDEGLGRVVATSAQKRDLSALLRQAGIEDLIEESTSASEVDASKPDPDVVQAALEQSGEPPERVVMLGDTPYDVQAARRAGIRIVGVRCGGWSDADLRGAVAVYADPAELLARFDGSPLAPNGGGG